VGFLLNLDSLVEDVVAAAGSALLGAGKVALVSSLSCECMLFMKAMDFCCGSTIASLSLPSAKQYASCKVIGSTKAFPDYNY